jgi:hypothetical protein
MMHLSSSSNVLNITLAVLKFLPDPLCRGGNIGLRIVKLLEDLALAAQQSKQVVLEIVGKFNTN